MTPYIVGLVGIPDSDTWRMTAAEEELWLGLAAES